MLRSSYLAYAFRQMGSFEYPDTVIFESSHKQAIWFYSRTSRKSSIVLSQTRRKDINWTIAKMIFEDRTEQLQNASSIQSAVGDIPIVIETGKQTTSKQLLNLQNRMLDINQGNHLTPQAPDHIMQHHKVIRKDCSSTFLMLLNEHTICKRL